ncbi:GNAT family N-acetyltransferase [Corynebacterium falsenii]|uniref:GNAT family N-acetyltransferase n=1 Tax=Corynebacterium falsenii TaxID=108486 RepID=UPI00234C4F5F|nr:GNAT family N-acetyltransferase [Corynebacterium falsenii]MDC7104260.1 GNAT family N-acetyltransferase [Corynebacterium falsenii]
MAPSIYYTGRALLNMPAQQVHDLYKLRVDVFVHEQQAPYAEIDDIDPRPNTHHILAYANPPLQLVGTARVFGGVEEQHIGRMCVHKDFRGQGIARQIMTEALDVCRARAAALDPTTQSSKVTLDAQTYIQDFYASLGFTPVGEPFDLDGVEHVTMEMTL